jgi:hypothetical protein
LSVVKTVRSRPLLFLVAALALFRLAYGLTCDFWTEDERQIYLIGLRAYARGEWPYFGPDVVWTGSRIPGALQGLLIAAPLRIAPLPESPFVLLNLLSLAALALLAWLLCRRLPELPKAFVWTWLLTTPWTLNFSTHVVNPSYVFFGAALFFAGFIEALPALRRDVLPLPVAFALMGVGMGWVAQLHLSWVLLPPYAALALVMNARSGWRRAAVSAGALLLAMGLISLTLLPTLVRFGVGGTGRNVLFIARDAWTLLTIAARFLSFASFEIARFMEVSTSRRLAVLYAQPWLVPLVLLVGAAGVVQPLALLALGLLRRAPPKEWGAVRLTAILTVLWVFVAYCFSSTEPLAHAFYVVSPAALIYAAYAWALVFEHRAVRIAWWTLLPASLLLHVGLAVDRLHERSLYADRSVVAAAIDRHDDLLLGQRRHIGAGAEPGMDDATLLSRAAEELEVTRARWRPIVSGRVSQWRVTLTHHGSQAAYLEIRYVTRYWDADEQPRGSGSGTIRRILQPGTSYTFRLVDGLVIPGAVRGEFAVMGGEAVKPQGDGAREAAR